MTTVRTNFKKQKASHFIREWRKHRGLSQQELADLVGVTDGAISQLERGDTKYTQPMLEAIARALFCTPADLVSRDPDDTSSAWIIHDKIRAASPDQAKKAIEMLELFLKAG